jgi:hypothetical protein
MPRLCPQLRARRFSPNEYPYLIASDGDIDM